MSSGTDAGRAAAFLERYRARADARLVVLLDGKAARLDGLPFSPDRYHSLLREYVLRGGKRLRGALVTLGFEAASGRDGREVLDESLAFELVHAYLLAFDDVMDRDTLRRGGKALHVLCAEEAQARGSRDAEHRGVSVTLLLGMLAQSLSLELLLGSRSARAREAAAWFTEVLEGVTVGQLLDVSAADAPGAGAEEVAAIHERKTGLYTTEGPLVLGALLAGATLDEPTTTALRGWARPVGKAFQLIDDLLGVVGDPKETGKPASGDLREGKRTAVLEEALAGLAGSDRARLEALIGRPLDQEEVEAARSLVVRSGAVEAVRSRSAALVEEGRQALDGSGLAPEAVRLLGDLGRLVVERSR